ncbi:MAG: hypothetical protein NVS1B13_14950 [Flavisolibacter sp.]
MWIDIVTLTIVILGISKGFQKGLVNSLFSFLAFVVGLAASLKLSAIVARYLEKQTHINQKWLPFLAFVVVFLVVVLLVKLCSKMVEKLVNIVMLGWLDRLGGIFLHMLLYLTFFSILLFYATGLHLITPETIRASLSYRFIQPLAPKVMACLGYFIPQFRDMFEDLLRFFENSLPKNKLSESTHLLMSSRKAILG